LRHMLPRVYGTQTTVDMVDSRSVE